MDDKYSGHHKSNNDSRRRSSRYDSYRNRSRDRQKYRRHFSPEKSRRNISKYLDSHNSRSEFNRHRVLESPSPDRLHNYQRRNRETRSRFDRDEYYDNERNRDRQQDNYSIKHKLPNDTEELPNKKKRHTSTNKYEEEKRCIEDKALIPYSVPVVDINYMHCQSPDYSVMPEMISTQPIREIRLTAVTELDDPRLFSKRYVLHQGDNGISTITGRNIDLKVIDTLNWGIKRVDIPKALTRRPSQCSDDIVQNIYMDIDNPVSNMSLESGEIMPYQRDDLDLLLTNKSSHKQYSDEVPNNNATSDKQSTSKDLSILRYKIPKLKKEIEKNHGISHYNAKEIEEKRVISLKINDDNINEKQSNSLISENMKRNKSPEKAMPNTSDKLGPFNTQVLTSSKHKNARDKNAREPSVEKDLELSDETCDNTDERKNLNTENNITSYKDKNKVQQLDSLHCPSETSKTNAVLDSETNPETITNEDVKKSKSKRRTHKASKEPDATLEKRIKPKKDTKVQKEINSKFSELFGDTTSSLITPDDLGILPTETHVQTSVQYIPICEDAQDVDLLKSVENEALHSSSTINNDVNNTNGDRNLVTETAIKLPNQLNYKTTKIDNDSEEKKPKKNETDKNSSSNNNDIYSTISCDFESKDMRTDISESQKNEYFEENNGNPNDIQNILIQKPDLLLKALATSTPHKDTNLTPVTGNSTSNSDCINNSKPNIIVSIDSNSVAKDQSSNAETLDSQTETDAPDVRVFVKRRRKVMKKSKP
ncbi:unnamed protein product [Diatraea saccharalis]|uniref:Uncharacterized protein n=1 Tax=Diatraea saccharalis TaxID=40085 RepID=A0A9P0C7D0_9NEOP|nr:unnamed protein product [Diatraea saccharalis]